MTHKQNIGFIKKINPIWRNIAIGFILMAMVSFYLDERISEKYELTDPIQTVAILIDTYCNTQAKGRSQVDYLGAKYKYSITNEESKNTYPYFATHVIYVSSRNECEIKTPIVRTTMQKIPIWYERTEPTKATFSLEKGDTLKNAKFSLALAFIALLVGIFWAWAMQEK
jgi:hypothetical protein